MRPPLFLPLLSALCLLLFSSITSAQAQSTAQKAKVAALTLSFVATPQSLTARDLLARPGVTDLKIARDVAYKRTMTYKAVPLLALIGNAAAQKFDTLQASATDGFVSQIPMALVRRALRGGSVAWIAIEPPEQPWPKIAGKDISAGPFYLVWQSPVKSRVGPEQWPYAIASLTGVRSPVQRWPQLAVSAAKAKASARSKKAVASASRGLAVFIKHCLACHKLNGGGEATVGPDVMVPMPATQYMTAKGLRALIRNPAAVRTWPQQQMPAFTVDALNNRALDDLMSYLRFKATEIR